MQDTVFLAKSMRTDPDTDVFTTAIADSLGAAKVAIEEKTRDEAGHVVIENLEWEDQERQGVFRSRASKYNWHFIVKQKPLYEFENGEVLPEI